MEKAAEKNQSLGISGSMVFRKNHFLQVLEGPIQNVNELYARLIKDIRHSGLVLVSYERIFTRDFQNWGMQYFDGDKAPESKNILQLIGESNRIGPFPCDKNLALELLLEYSNPS